MQHVDPYFVSSDDECHAVLPLRADCRMDCRQCNTANAADNRVVVVECTDCLSTPGKDDCLCPSTSQSRRAGLDNDNWVATQDWQEYEYRQGIYTLKVEENGPLVEQDIWMQVRAAPLRPAMRCAHSFDKYFCIAGDYVGPLVFGISCREYCAGSCQVLETQV